MNKLDAKKINNMKVRTYSALYIVGIMSLVIILSFFASWSYSSLIIGSSIGAHIVSIIAQGLLILLFCGFLYLCLKEIFDCFVKTYNKKHFIIFYIFSVITLLIINICLIFYSYYKYEYIKLSYFLLLMLYSSISSLILSLAFKIIKKEYKINFLFILTVIFINFAINCIIYISITRWFSTILLLIVVTACFDAGAYFCGSFFGKHKIAPIISPNKTWEGAIGGWTIGIIFFMLIVFVYSFGNNNFNLNGAFFGPSNKVTSNAALLYGISFGFAFLIAIGSYYGDLIFSLIKRRNGIKDFSNLIPGHGGVLDRFDSLSAVFVIFTIFSCVFNFI